MTVINYQTDNKRRRGSAAEKNATVVAEHGEQLNSNKSKRLGQLPGERNFPFEKAVIFGRSA